MTAEKGKAPIIFLTALLIISLGISGGVYITWQKEKTKSSGLQEELNTVKSAQKVTESKLEESKRMLQALEVKLKDTMAQVDSLNKDLEQEKSGKEEAVTQLEQLQSDLEQQKTLRSDFEDKFLKAQTEVKAMESKLTALEIKKTELEAKVKELEQKTQGVELGTIVVNPEPEKPADKKAAKKVETKKTKKEEAKKEAARPASLGLEGKVLVVNKDYNFAVIDLGSKDGINVGDTFGIYHGGKYIGDVKVEKVHESMSAAGFGSDKMKDLVGEGDRAERKK